MAGVPTPLNAYRNAELSLEALVDTAVLLLRRLEVHPGDGRVAEVPDARGVRYYQTIGVVDRPLRYDGRRAVYGFRHVLQLLAVKQLQQEGHPLSLIQQSLAGCPTAVLEQAIGALLSNRRVQTAPTAASEAHSRREPASPTDRAVAPPITARVAPGVTLSLDPALVRDPGDVIARVADALARTRPSPDASATKEP